VGCAAQKNPPQGIAALVAGVWQVFPVVIRLIFPLLQ
jgi:hypothetical protein